MDEAFDSQGERVEYAKSVHELTSWEMMTLQMQEDDNRHKHVFSRRGKIVVN